MMEVQMLPETLVSFCHLIGHMTRKDFIKSFYILSVSSVTIILSLEKLYAFGERRKIYYESVRKHVLCLPFIEKKIIKHGFDDKWTNVFIKSVADF
jgi:hypothetical protein